MRAQDTVCIIGGSGFVGHHLANRLTDQGYRVRVATRRRERSRHLLVNPAIELVEADVYDSGQLRKLFSGCVAAVNLVGILNETAFDGSGFRRAHVDLARLVMEACKAEGVPRLLHMSALNADASVTDGHYLRTKGEGEDLVHDAASDQFKVTSFRPSVIFGPGDSFFNRFGGLLKLSPIAFPLACPDARFAPVFVHDVVDAFLHCLKDDSTAGLRLDLCGPNTYTLQDLVKYTAEVLGLKRMILRLPDFAARLQAKMLQLVPGKPFTMDNYWSLQIDSVCKENGFEQLGITPRSVESQVPTYLANKHIRGRYDRYRRAANRS